MVERYRFAATMACAVLAGAAIIVAIQRINVPGTEFIRPPENGVGTRCAQGDRDACERLCTSLSNVSTIRCVDHLAMVFPRVHDGSQISGSGPASSGSGGSGSGSGGASQPTTTVGGSVSPLPGGSGGGSGGGGGSGNGPPGPHGPPGPPGPPGPTGPPGNGGGGNNGGGNGVSICVRNPLLPACVTVTTPRLPTLP